MATASRRQARITALQTLYEVDTTQHPVGDVLRRNLDEPASEAPASHGLADPGGREFARALVEGVLSNREELDSIIERSAPSWPIEQMSSIDKNILRLHDYHIHMQAYIEWGSDD